jgi:hypothetical protein
MVLSRQRGGKPLLEIYRHFDRDNKMYFDAKDFVRATSDLRIETTERYEFRFLCIFLYIDIYICYIYLSQLGMNIWHPYIMCIHICICIYV